MPERMPAVFQVLLSGPDWEWLHPQTTTSSENRKTVCIGHLALLYLPCAAPTSFAPDDLDRPRRHFPANEVLDPTPLVNGGIDQLGSGLILIGWLIGYS
jgi:hypothetical protein